MADQVSTTIDPEDESLLTPDIRMLRNNLDDGYNYQYRRHEPWATNYELYRDKVIVNRLTQRQSVNLPLMKTVIRTSLKDIDDMPVLYFENLDNDKQAELFKNEYWKYTQDVNHMDLQDIVDKRQVLIFGRSFDQWQIVDGKVKMTVEDPQDILVQRYCNPYDLNSTRFLIHMHIFVPLSKIKLNPDYNKDTVADMETWYSSQDGLIKASDNQKMLAAKNKKMQDMGVPDVASPVLGETYVELTLHFVFRDNEPIPVPETTAGENAEDSGEEQSTKYYDPQFFLYVVADNMRLLMKKPLEEVIGITKDNYWRDHLPYVSWADDLERQDFWSDAVADIVRTPNVVLNTWFSQLVENRTLRSFGMNYYNSNIEGFNPSAMVPIPWGWYGIPIPTNADIRTVIQKVEIPDLADSLPSMNFIIQMVEKATGATAGQQGAPSEKKITLGEFNATLLEAKERVKGMSKFYTPAWKQRGEIFIKLLEAAPDRLDAVKIQRKGRNSNNVYTREIMPKDWQTPSGYTVKIWSQDEKDTNDINVLQKQNAVKQAMPSNPKVNEIYQRKLLEWADYTPDEINEIMQWEKEQRDNLLAGIQGAMGGGNVMPGSMPGAHFMTPPAGNSTPVVSTQPLVS